MTLSRLFLAFVVSLALSGCVVIKVPAAGARLDFHRQQELSLNAEQLSALHVRAGAGSLQILGASAESDIRVSADIYSSRADFSNIDLALTHAGDNAVLVAEKRDGGFSSSNARIDLVMHLPMHLSLAVEDGSGDIEVANIGKHVSIIDGSGDINVSNVGGTVSIEDGSGSLYVKQVSGSMSIIDGSGGIELNNLSGAVDITDGSGEIVINHLASDLTVDDDSGALEAKNVNGNVTINDGSGDLYLKEIGGVVTIDDGSGSIDIDGAGGLTIIEAGSGGLNVDNVSGALNVND